MKQAEATMPQFVHEGVQEQLCRADCKYAALVENAIEGILLTSASGRIIGANSAASRLLGYKSSRELADGSDFERHFYIDPSDRPRLKEQLLLGTAVLECVAYRTDGEAVPVSLKISVIVDIDNREVRHQIFVEDLTERKQMEYALQASESRYRALTENAVTGIYRSDLNGQFLEVNHALVAMLGYESREELLALNLDRDIYLEPGARTKLLNRYSEVERIAGVLVHWKRKDGTPITVRLSGRKVREEVGVLDSFEILAEEIPEIQSWEHFKVVA